MRLLARLCGPMTVIALWVILLGLSGGILPFVLLRGLDVADVRSTLAIGVTAVVCALVFALMGADRGPSQDVWRGLLAGGRGLLRALGVRRTGLGRLLLIGVGSAVLLFGANVLLAGGIDWQAITGAAAATQDVRRDWTEALSVPGLVALGLIVGPPGEELLYRGGLLLVADGLSRRLPGWLRRTLTGGALLATTVMFGLIHVEFSVQNVATAMINGFAWGVISLKTRSVIPSLVSHGLFNTGVFLLW